MCDEYCIALTLIGINAEKSHTDRLTFPTCTSTVRKRDSAAEETYTIEYLHRLHWALPHAARTVEHRSTSVNLEGPNRGRHACRNPHQLLAELLRSRAI